MSKDISRRSFLKGTLATAAGAVLAAGMGGVTAFADGDKPAIEDPWAGFRASDWADKVTETVETDIVIVGGGASGLVASLEAAQQGKKVLVLESQETLGGNGALSDCMFTFGSPEQKAAAEKYGITIEPRDILRSEVEMFDYQVPPILWLDVINHSADNTAWLQAAGAKFADEVDYYGSLGKSPTAFMWAGGVGSGGPNFTQPVSETCKAAGVEFLMSTRARALKTEDGKVTGVYAETPDGVIEVTAKATILAGGGWAANAEMDAQYGGFNMERDVALTWAKGCQGDSLKMAAAIGARQDAISRGYMLMGAVNGVAGAKLFSECYALWVNEDGDRFTNEDVIELCNDYQTNANRGQKQSYIILGNEMVDKAEEKIAGLRESVEKNLGVEKHPTFKADTVEELAEAMGVSAENLKATFARYEEHVANGEDADFGKDPKYLVSLGEGPYYALPTYQMVCLSLGGINTNRYWQVVDQVKNPIPNLYAIGADGQMVYLGFYNLNTSGGHMAVNIESGRYSVKHAVANCF